MSGLGSWPAPLALVLAVALLYGINLGQPPHPDELYHVLAARGLLATGEPQIAEGLYTRAFLHTRLMALSFGLFGESLSTARLPSLLCMAALVGLLFVFLRREAGPAAAWIGAVLFALSPFAVDLARFARFYAPQCLVFFAAAWIVYDTLGRPFAWWRWLAAALVAGALFLLALHFQPTTFLGIAGLGIWAAAYLLWPWLFGPRLALKQRRLLLLGLVLAGVAAVLLAWASGLLGPLWAKYRSTPLFNEGQAGQFWFYHVWYTLYYPALWPATGIVALLALAARPRLGTFLLAVFVIGFLLNSFAASKSLRYIAYAQPFLFGLWGIGLAALLASFTGLLAGLRARLTAVIALPPAWAGRLSAFLVAAAAALLVLANPAWLRTATLLAGVTVPPEQPPVDWLAAKPALEPWLERAEIVVTTEELGALYYLGRHDILLSPSKLGELGLPPAAEIGRDFRTGRPVIGNAAKLAQVIGCYRSGLFIALAKNWGGGPLRDAEVERLLYQEGTPLELPPRSRLVAFVWEHPAAPATAAACAGLPPPGGT